MRAWEEETRLAILDREGAFFGRTSERGILQRFHPSMDSEYDLDLLSSAFGLAAEHEWYARESGARFQAGSIDHLRLVQRGEIKTFVGLGDAWGVSLRFTHDESLRTRRSLIRLGVRRMLGEGGGRAFVRATLRAVKPETDIEAGVTWPLAGGELTVAVAALDLFSDLNYQGLGVSPAVADTALDYTAHPFTARAALEVPLGRRWRVEAYGLHLFPAGLSVESQTRPGDGFVQDESYDYAGGLVSFAPSRRLALAGLATWVRARLHRQPLAAGRPADDFTLTEVTSRLGLIVVRHLTRRFSVEGELARVWRSEERRTSSGSLEPVVDYDDRTWTGRWSLVYRADSGFRAQPGLDFTARSGRGEPPVEAREPFDDDHFRLRGDLGWSFDDRAHLMVGGNFDLDAGGFDGAHGRFALYW